MSQALVSVVIPCFNVADCIGQTLDSVCGQSWSELEIIAVDDGSRDETAAIVSAWNDPRVVLLRQENRGAAAARNTGLSQAKGEFIQFLDADDLIAADKIQTQMRRLADEPPGTVASCRWARFVDDPAGADGGQRPVYRDYEPVEYLLEAVSRDAVMHPAAWLVPAAVAQVAGPWEESLSLNDDAEYFARVVLASQGVRYCPDTTSYYRSFRLGSLSHRRDEAARRSRFASTELIARHLLAVEDSARTRAACGRMYLSFIRRMYPWPRDLILRSEQAVAEYLGPQAVPGTLHKLRHFVVMGLRRGSVALRRRLFR